MILTIWMGIFSSGVRASEPPEALVIRKSLPSRLPDLAPIDEVRRTPWPGLYELRSGTEVFYSDRHGDFLIQGALLDTRGGPHQIRNLTEERVETLTRINFHQLPLRDALVIQRGEGKHIMAIFEDPNCGYCKRLEQDLIKLNNALIYIFLYPVLGQDSQEKSRVLWCADNKAQAWQDWMLRGQLPHSHANQLHCDTAALSRNLALGKRHKIEGVPTFVFADGSRLSAALSLADLERELKNRSPKSH
jgi:thiol:disulfide interchange protein DsbC